MVRSVIKMDVSSTKLNISVFKFVFILNRSFIQIMNNNGPSSVPCGTPYVIYIYDIYLYTISNNNTTAF